MEAYTSIFDSIPWREVGHTVIQTITLYWLLLLGLRLVGRRVFGEMSPQDIIILLLIAESCNLGLTNEQAGYWGAVASVLTIFGVGAFAERVAPLRRILEEQPVVLFKNGQLHKREMKRNLVDENDLNQVAREYGLDSYHEFEAMTLEGDGSITGTLRLEMRSPRHRRQKPLEG